MSSEIKDDDPLRNPELGAPLVPGDEPQQQQQQQQQHPVLIKQEEMPREVPEADIDEAASYNFQTRFTDQSEAWERADTTSRIQSKAAALEHKRREVKAGRGGGGLVMLPTGGDGRGSPLPGGGGRPNGPPPPPPPGGGGVAYVHPVLNPDHELHALWNAYNQFFRGVAGKLDKTKAAGTVFLQGNIASEMDLLHGIKGFEQTWWIPLYNNVESWIRDALQWVEIVQKKKKGRVLFSDQLLNHSEIFLNLAMLLRWKNKDREKQQTWPNKAIVQEHNNDLCRIAAYYMRMK